MPMPPVPNQTLRRAIRFPSLEHAHKGFPGNKNSILSEFTAANPVCTGKIALMAIRHEADENAMNSLRPFGLAFHHRRRDNSPFFRLRLSSKKIVRGASLSPFGNPPRELAKAHPVSHAEEVLTAQAICLAALFQSPGSVQSREKPVKECSAFLFLFEPALLCIR
jgi:hypothetical protein